MAVLTPDAQQIIAATYLGGKGGDTVEGIAVDKDGNVIVAGETTSIVVR